MDLPLELRMLIYDYMLQVRAKKNRRTVFEVFCGHNNDSSRLLSIAILMCSKQVYAEVMPRLYANSEVYLGRWGGLRNFHISRKDPKALECVRSINVYCSDVLDNHVDPSSSRKLDRICQRFPNLRKLVLHHGRSPGDDALWLADENVTKLMLTLMHACTSLPEARCPSFKIIFSICWSDSKFGAAFSARLKDMRYEQHMVFIEHLQSSHENGTRKNPLSRLPHLKEVIISMPATTQDFTALMKVKIGKWGLKLNEWSYDSDAYLSWKAI